MTESETSHSAVEKVIPSKLICRHSKRPGFDLDKLAEDTLNAIWQRYCKNDYQDFFFKTKHLECWGLLNTTLFTKSLVSRIIRKKLTPFPCKIHSRSKGTVFRTVFNKKSKSGGK